MTSADVVPAPGDGPWAIHATAVAIGGRALLIRGPSKAGKSRLALALIAASSRRRPIILLGDDRIILTPSADGLIARPHPRIAGFMERRGLGIVSMPFAPAAKLGGVVDLVPPHAPLRPAGTAILMAGSNLPMLSIVAFGDPDARDASDLERCARVLRWFSEFSIGFQCATKAPHPLAKACRDEAIGSKD